MTSSSSGHSASTLLKGRPAARGRLLGAEEGDFLPYSAAQAVGQALNLIERRHRDVVRKVLDVEHADLADEAEHLTAEVEVADELLRRERAVIRQHARLAQ